MSRIDNKNITASSSQTNVCRGGKTKSYNKPLTRSYTMSPSKRIHENPSHENKHDMLERLIKSVRSGDRELAFVEALDVARNNEPYHERRAARFLRDQ